MAKICGSCFIRGIKLYNNEQMSSADNISLVSKSLYIQSHGVGFSICFGYTNSQVVIIAVT